MGFKEAILLVCLAFNLTAASYFHPFKAPAIQNDGICGGNKTCLNVDDSSGSAGGCCWSSCAGHGPIFKDHLSRYDGKCSGGKKCCGYKNFGK